MAADSTEVADALLLRLRTLQVQCATLTRVALYSAKPPVAFEVSSPLTNRPTSAAFRSSLKPLSSRHRRYTGTPFFVGFDGDVPDPNPDQVRRESAPETKLKLREQHLRFTADDDNALLAAVLHVHRAERFAEALARYGLTFPSAFLPLGSVSTPALEPSQLGPRADTQYSDCFSAASLPAQAWAALDTLSRATLERELDEIASAPPAVLLARVQDCDWVRVCHGGFLRSKLGARPSDARVRWCAHVRPGLYNGAWVASERSQLAQIAARHDFRDWATIAAELAGEGKKLRSAWDCFHEYRHSTQAGVRDSAARGGAAALDEIADVGLDVEDGDAEGIATPEVSNSSLGLENTGVGVGTPLTRGGGRVRAAPGSRKWTAEHDARAVIFAHVMGEAVTAQYSSQEHWKREATSHFPPGLEVETVRRRCRHIHQWCEAYHEARAINRSCPEPQRAWSPTEDKALGLAIRRCMRFADAMRQKTTAGAAVASRAFARAPPAQAGPPTAPVLSLADGESLQLWRDVSAAFAGLRSPEQCDARWRFISSQCAPVTAAASAAPSPSLAVVLQDMETL